MNKENLLPENWFETKLEEISDPVSTSGKKIKTKDALPFGKYPVIDQGISPISGYVNDPSLLVPASIDKPIIIFGDHTRIVKYVTKDFVPGADGTKLIRAKNEIDFKYLKYLIQQADIPDRGYGRHYQFLKSVNLPLAPKNEQRRIAHKLDTTLARVDALNDRLARITPLLKRFRQSVLAAATSGKLTEDWREARGLKTSWQIDSTYGELPDFWSVLDIDKLKSEEKYSLAIGPFGSNLKTTDYTDAGVPLVFVREIRARSFGGNKTKFVSLTKADDLKAHKVTGGDILITKMGDPPGDVAIYPYDKEDAVITADCIKLKINKKIANNSYISFALESPSFKSVFMTAVAGVAQQKVSLARFRELPIVVPPLDEQTEIVRRVETLFAFADRLEARLQSAQTAAERLTPALLAKAFRGELVPQDPNDEPATELLRRLREARAADTAAKPKSTRGRKLAT